MIAARNEEDNLMEHIPLLMEQNYPEFEVIVVNDSSWDDTQEILKALQIQFPNMHLIHLDEEKQNMQGKKFAITLGIKAAKHELILLTDADCRPTHKNWIREMAASMSDSKSIVLGFSPYSKAKGWLNKVIRFDTLMIGLHYLGMAKAGRPYMGVGRNLMYKKELFFSVGGFKSHYSVQSGDDDLFINQVANKRNTAVQFSPEAQTISEPKKTWGDWKKQKKRHFTTLPHYKASDRNLLAFSSMSYVLMMAGFVGSMVLKNGMFVVGGMLLSRYIIQLSILHGSVKRLGMDRDVAWLSPFLEVQLLFANALIYFSNLVRKQQKWK
ncbi:MAG: glycosyltransferase [Flavobacteriales bacterium]